MTHSAMNKYFDVLVLDIIFAVTIGVVASQLLTANSTLNKFASSQPLILLVPLALTLGIVILNFRVFAGGVGK